MQFLESISYKRRIKFKRAYIATIRILYVNKFKLHTKDLRTNTPFTRDSVKHSMRILENAS